MEKLGDGNLFLEELGAASGQIQTSAPGKVWTTGRGVGCGAGGMRSVPSPPSASYRVRLFLYFLRECVDGTAVMTTSSKGWGSEPRPGVGRDSPRVGPLPWAVSLASRPCGLSPVMGLDVAAAHLRSRAPTASFLPTFVPTLGLMARELLPAPWLTFCHQHLPRPGSHLRSESLSWAEAEGEDGLFAQAQLVVASGIQVPHGQEVLWRLLCSMLSLDSWESQGSNGRASEVRQRASGRAGRGQA